MSERDDDNAPVPPRGPSAAERTEAEIWACYAAHRARGSVGAFYAQFMEMARTHGYKSERTRQDEAIADAAERREFARQQYEESREASRQAQAGRRR